MYRRFITIKGIVKERYWTFILCVFKCVTIYPNLYVSKFNLVYKLKIFGSKRINILLWSYRESTSTTLLIYFITTNHKLSYGLCHSWVIHNQWQEPIMTFHCLQSFIFINDPRWDRDCEVRSDYVFKFYGDNQVPPLLICGQL